MIDTKKAIRFYNYMTRDETILDAYSEEKFIIMSDVVSTDENVCLCKADNEYILFEIESGSVLTKNYPNHRAENYRPDVIIKIATITDNRRSWDYLDLTHMKFSNKEDFSDNFIVKAISITDNDGVITEILMNVKLSGVALPENIETECKYIKLTLWNEQYNKEEFKEYHVKMTRNVGAIMVDGKAVAQVSHNYILHNPDDYAYKYYMGYTEYEKGYFVDGGKVPDFYMGYRSKLNKVNRVLNNDGEKSKIQLLKTFEDADKETPMRYAGKRRAFFTLDSFQIEINLIPGIIAENIDESFFEPIEEFLDEKRIAYKKGDWLKNDIIFSERLEPTILEEIYNYMVSVGFVLDTYKNDKNYRFMTKDKPDISEYKIYVGWQDFDEQCGTGKGEYEYFQDKFSFHIYTSHETECVYDQSVGWIDDRIEKLLKHINSKSEGVYISFGVAENCHVIYLHDVSKSDLRDRAKNIIKRIKLAVDEADYFEWYNDKDDVVVK